VWFLCCEEVVLDAVVVWPGGLFFNRNGRGYPPDIYCVGIFVAAKMTYLSCDEAAAKMGHPIVVAWSDVVHPARLVHTIFVHCSPLYPDADKWTLPSLEFPPLCDETALRWGIRI
jgi:hypothetical protein